MKAGDIWAANTKVKYQGASLDGIAAMGVNVFRGSMVDATASEHRLGCEAAGIPPWPYCVLNYSQPPAFQAPRMLGLCDPFELIPAADLEFVDVWGRPTDDPKDRYEWRGKLLAWLLRFYEAFDAEYDGDSLLYLNLDMIKLLRPIPEILTRRLLWLACTLTNPAPALFAPWKEITIQQYALDVVAPWSNGVVDLNRVNVPLERLYKKHTYHQYLPIVTNGARVGDGASAQGDFTHPLK